MDVATLGPESASADPAPRRVPDTGAAPDHRKGANTGPASTAEPPERLTPTTFDEHRAREAAMRVRHGGPSCVTADLLRRLDLWDAAERRRANFAALHALLPPGATDALLGPDDHAPAWAPLGLPVLVPDARAASAAMAARGVFCAVAWPDLAAPGPCRRARALANRVLLLPCHGRHGPADMARVAETFRGLRR